MEEQGRSCPTGSDATAQARRGNAFRSGEPDIDNTEMESGQSGSMRASSSPSFSQGDSMRSDSEGAGSNAAERIRSRLTDVASQGKHRLAEEIRHFGQAADAAASCLQEKELPQVGRYAGAMKEQCEHAADYIERKDPMQIRDDACRMARSNPALFLGAAALTGFAIGRFISASASQSSQSGAGSQRPQRSESPAQSSVGSVYSEGGM